MSEFFKDKRKMGLTMCALMLVVILSASSVAMMLSDGGLFAEKDEAPEEEQGELLDLEGELVGDDGEADTAAEEPEAEAAPISYNIPSEMRGVFLVPGSDILTDLTASESEIKAEIDKALTDAENFTMNTVIVDTVYGDKVIFPTAGADAISVGFDVMDYVVSGARAKDMHVYAIFDASLFTGAASNSVMLSMGGNSVSALSGSLSDFASTYGLDGILIDGYGEEASDEVSYSTYLLSGGAIGYDNYLRQTPSALVKTASNAIRSASPSTQVGLLAHAVWANESENAEGSATQASFTSLNSANADTKGFVESGLVDFVAVRAYGSLTDDEEPFDEVVSWWADVARQNGVPMYVVHAADRICTENSGWSGSDQITKQVIQASSTSGVRGSMFNSLSRMVANPNDATTTLVKYFNEEVEAAHILSELEMTKPEQLVFTTQEPSVTFTGASDPNSPVTINGEQVTTDANGYFTTSITLSAGENIFTIEHKEKTITYKITRDIDIVKDVTPTGSLATDGGMSITITALAYEDAQVYASINGSTVSMSIDSSYESESARDSNYRLFVGVYTAPAGTESAQNLGAITVTATWQGQSKTLTGASVTVNKRAKLEDGVAVVVIADQATTYPASTLNNIPDAGHYPLPKGAMDYAVGEELTYVSGGTTYKYYQLASGVRVESDDIQALSSDYAGQNAISGMTVHTESGYTYLTIKTAQQVSYLFDYSSTQVKITFNYTTSTPGGSTALTSNPLFSNASWGDDSLTLTLMKSGGFMGFKGYYDSAGNLVFRFNNPPSSISSARIAIDPGHGGNDPGALGFLKEYPEKVINLAIAQLLADELESRGATVLLLDTSNNPSLQNRVAQAESFGADIFVSVHNNTAPNSSAVGTEVYYFYSYSKTLASSASSSVSSSFGTTNRGAKQSYYTVTLSPQFASVLVECGFMSNQSEYEKLIKTSYQQRIAEGIADGIAATINATYTGSTASGTQTVGTGAATTDTEQNTSGSVIATEAESDSTESGSSSSSSSSSGSNGSGVVVEDFQFTKSSYNIEVGAEQQLDIQVGPSDGDPATLTWKSSSTSVASVASDGTITAKKEGETEITATTQDGVSKSCTVYVIAKSSSASSASATVSLSNADNLRFSPYEVDLYKGSKETLVILSDQGTVSNSEFSWESTDTSVATVNASGVVTAKNTKGSCEIIATSKDGYYQLSCEVNVYTTQVSVKSISLNKSSMAMARGATEQLTVTFNPTNATNKTVTWKSSNTSRATVDENGVVTAKNAGTVTITATSKDGKYTATCTVTVTARGVDPETVDIYSQTFGYRSIQLSVGETDYLEADLSPSDVTNTEVTWKSSNESVVKVSSSGKITAVGKGTATITVTSTADTSVKKTVTVTVS